MSITGQPKVVETCVRPCFGGFSGMGSLFFCVIVSIVFECNVVKTYLESFVDQNKAF